MAYYVGETYVTGHSTVLLPGKSTLVKKTTRMTMSYDDGSHLTKFRMAPTKVNYTGFGWTWEEIERPGRDPLLVPSKGNLEKISFTIKITNPFDLEEDQEYTMKKLVLMANTMRPIKVKYGGYFDSKLWRITNLSFDTIRRHPTNSKPTEVDASIELTRSSNVDLKTGPVSGGVKKSRTPAKKKKAVSRTPKGKSSSKSKKYHIMKRGDTLTGLAVKYYRDYSKWRKIGDANNIKNPRKIPIGKKMLIP